MRTQPGAALLELTTGAIAAGGGCVARADDGRVVFVRHSLPGERVVASITDEASSYVRADAVQVLRGSPDRVEPPCPYAGPGRCGGCDWQHIAVPAQRALKATLVSEQLRRIGGIDRPVVVEEVPGAPGAPDGLGWRTRVQFAVDRAGRAGLHRHRSHDIEPVGRCLIASSAVQAVGAERHRWPGATELEVAASADGSQRVVSVTSVGHKGAGQMPDLDAGLVVDGRLLRGPGGLRHRVLGRDFEVTAGSFWQVHPGGPLALARAVLDGLEPRGGDRAVDLYAGVGLFAALLGEAVGPTGSVLAIEAGQRAVADALRNTADQPHVKVRWATVTAGLVDSRLGQPDLVVLDPPRAGAGGPVTRSLAALRPRRLAYVACDPATFARDLRILLDAGWALGPLRAFDLFPMTEHVELVAILNPPPT